MSELQGLVFRTANDGRRGLPEILIFDARAGPGGRLALPGMAPSGAVALPLVSEGRFSRHMIFDHGYADYLVWPLISAELAIRLAGCRTLFFPANTDAPEARDPLVARCCAYMRRNLDRDIQLSEVVRELGTNRSSLSAHFRQTLGCSPIAWLRQTRLARAAELLETTALPVAEIGAAVGYDDSNNFSTAFRREYGAPPSLFRNSHIRKGMPDSRKGGS
ncbi:MULTISPECIES: helix-turn-helix domain-containing protein [Pacificimonas]|uniref:Helix-turn-helix transcriptional regulator n=1 Tax=Pacificimonas aurantium TaxID=1250540 RepID=A0ABS7WJG7_9SPHN|nr:MULTISPECIES: AraC family transcriptional regulator [Pacificimonas]MBZ6377822.1 helix-turn-helix transcriptional regulator [Pacificimonas aurantium]